MSSEQSFGTENSALMIVFLPVHPRHVERAEGSHGNHGRGEGQREFEADEVVRGRGEGLHRTRDDGLGDHVGDGAAGGAVRVVAGVYGEPGGDYHDGGIHPHRGQTDAGVACGVVGLDGNEDDEANGGGGGKEHEPWAAHAGSVGHIGKEESCDKRNGIYRDRHQLSLDGGVTHCLHQRWKKAGEAR